MSVLRTRSKLAAFMVLFSLMATAPLAHGADVQRGQLLYENHCLGCHDSRAHLRDDRRAQSLAEVRQWVVRWSNHLALNWGGDERNDVADYLYARYYSASQ